MKFRIAVVVGMLLACSGQGWTAPTNRPLDDVILDLDDAPLSQVKRIAKQMASQQFQMDKGPLYKSTPSVENRDPKALSDEVIFEGLFTTHTGNCRLALFSDDGCDVWINGERVLNNFKKGQHLPSLDQSLHVLKFVPKPGQTYRIKIHYGNTIYLGQTDIDGCTLFAFQGGGQMPEVTLITPTPVGVVGDKNRKTTVGTIVIADKDKVYSDTDEPARRRDVTVKLSAGKATVVINRGAIKDVDKKLAGNLRLFEKEKPSANEKDLFERLGKLKDPDEFELDMEVNKNLVFWLQAGPNPSQKVRDQFLTARVKNDNKADQINVTVFWVDISGHTFHEGLKDGEKGNPKTITKDPGRPDNAQVVYSGYQNVVTALGNATLGVRRSSGNRADEKWINGLIQINGAVLPSDSSLDAENKTPPFGVKITTKLVSPGEGALGKADFGFIFRRTFTLKVFDNAQAEPGIKHEKPVIDDSHAAFQDVDPNVFQQKLLIVDVDGPGVGLVANKFFESVRFNFVENVVFNFFPNTPERCSERLKWACTTDYALGYGDGNDDKAVFIRSLPNKLGSNINEVKVGEHLPTLDDVYAPEPNIKSAVNAAGKQLLKQGQDTTLTVKGANLIGEFLIRKGDQVTIANKVRVKAGKDQFSDLTEVQATFKTALAVGKDYELVIQNASKKGVPLKGFEIEK